MRDTCLVPFLLLALLVVVTIVVVGWAVVGLTLKLLWWALVGLVVGALARLVVPGRQALGWLATILFGVAGALAGGMIANALEWGSLLQLVVAVAVAAALVAIFGGTRARAA